MDHIQPKYKMLRSANTIRSWVIKNYEDQKHEVRQEINTALTQIHISFDCWTSRHHTMSVIGIVGHFTTRQGS